MEILIISGLSGSGKSRAATFLEDIGYYIVDNLPAEMMLKFANFCTASGGRYDRVALVYDVRAGEPFQRLVDVVDKLRRKGGVRCRMLFLEADTRAIISRYKETRRSHPLCAEGLSIEEAVRRERELLAPVRERADFVLDTSAFSTAKLRSELLSLFGGGDTQQALNVSVMSFGFKNGLPLEADLVFDVRFMPNPYYVESLRRKTGNDHCRTCSQVSCHNRSTFELANALYNSHLAVNRNVSAHSSKLSHISESVVKNIVCNDARTLCKCQQC